MKMLAVISGSTLMEMLAVIVIIGILAAIAVPSVQSGIIRKQIESALPLADVAKKPISASWAALQVLPKDNAAAGIPSADKIVNNFVSAVTVNAGVVNITFGNRAQSIIAGKILSFRPAVIDESPVVPVTWVCAKADPPEKMTVKGVDETTLPDAYLPLDCRKLQR